MHSQDDIAPKAKQLIDRRIILSETAFAELTLWQLPSATDERPHGYKYSLALIVAGICVMRFDNERGKGDHFHVGAEERPYVFRNVDQLIADFMSLAEELLNANGNA